MRSTEQEFRNEMTRRGLRVTDNRLAIFRALISAGKPLSALDIINATSGNGYFTSVYRSIDTMTRSGILSVVPRGSKTYYELGEALWPHHHYVTCELCGQTTSFDSEELEQLSRHLTLGVGLEPTRHAIELFGVCQQCRTESGATTAATASSVE